VERNKEVDGFVRLRWGETREQDAVGGARLTIEIGAEFAIGISSASLLVWITQGNYTMTIARANLVDPALTALIRFWRSETMAR
jgi:hypothetical protein